MPISAQKNGDVRQEFQGLRKWMPLIFLAAEAIAHPAVARLLGRLLLRFVRRNLHTVFGIPFLDDLTQRL